MAVDEKLASGLANRYFRWLYKSLEESMTAWDRDDFLDPRLDQYSGWRKNWKAIRDSRAHVSTREYVLDHKRSSFWAHVVVFPDEKTFIKPWEEQCLSAHAQIVRVSEEYPEFTDGHYLEISSHAIKRIFQRTDLGFHSDNTFHPQEITRLFTRVSDWAAIFTYLAPRPITDYHLYPAFPTSAGLFLGERHRDAKGAAATIRTFVALRQLTTQQRQAYDAMRRVMSLFSEVPFFLTVGLEVNNSTEIVNHDALMILYIALFFHHLGNDWACVRDLVSTKPGGAYRQDIADELDVCRSQFLGLLEYQPQLVDWVKRGVIPPYKSAYLDILKKMRDLKRAETDPKFLKNI